MLHITMTEPPVAGCVDFKISFEDKDRNFTHTINLSDVFEPFEDIDDFLYDIACKKPSKLEIECEGPMYTFRAIKYDDNWNVTLKVEYDDNHRHIYEDMFTIPTYNLLYELGKILSIRIWLHKSYKTVSIEQEEQYKKSWEISHQL